MSRRLTRRTFLRDSSALTAATWMTRTLSARDKEPPSERLRVGVIGVAAQGNYNLTNVARESIVDIVALCDVDTERAKSARERFPQAKFFQDFHKLLDQPN